MNSKNYKFFSLSFLLTAQVQIFLPCTFGSYHGQSPERNQSKQLIAAKNLHKIIFYIILSLNLTYFHPTIDPHPTQKMSATVCIPVIIFLSSFTPTETFTLSDD